MRIDDDVVTCRESCARVMAHASISTTQAYLATCPHGCEKRLDVWC